MFDDEIFEHDGMKFRVTFPIDDSGDTPWEREDGHGAVSDWRYWAQGQGVKPPKSAGERILIWNRGDYRTYDFAGAVALARKDGWRPAGDVAGMTAGQIAAAAAEEDFNRLRAWCDNGWCYVGVVVTLVDDEGEPMGETESLWGIESDSADYLEQVAHELAGEIVHRLLGAGGAHAHG